MKLVQDVSLSKAMPATQKLMCKPKSLKIRRVAPKFRGFFISFPEIVKAKAVKVLISGIPNQKTHLP